MAEFFSTLLREELSRSWRTRLGDLLAKPAFVALRRRTDYQEYGAAPLLGIDGGCFIGHGSSRALAIKNSIRRAEEFASAEFTSGSGDKVAELHAQEDRLLPSEADEPLSEGGLV